MRWLVRTLAGIQTGILAGLTALAWMILTSGWDSPNRLGAVFHGPRAGLGYHTASGIALLLVLFAGSAIVWSLVLRPGWPWARSLLFGMSFALAFHLLQSHFLWKRLSPGLLDSASPVSVWGAWLILGFALSFAPWLIRSMEREFLLN